jgi:transcriptional regulator GlxA family with amidase domain
VEKIGTMPSQRDQTDIIRIGVLPIDGFALMSYASTVEPFRAANMLSRRMLYEVVNIGPSLELISSSGAASVAPQATLLTAPRLDYLFVVAGGNPATFADMAVWNWLAKIARFGVRLGGVSGGPVILANAGLMAERRMTVHWEHAAALEESAPHLLLERSLYVIDRDRLTCAGGTAALDLMLALITQHQGISFCQFGQRLVFTYGNSPCDRTSAQRVDRADRINQRTGVRNGESDGGACCGSADA